jgi:hypothetical protein
LTAVHVAREVEIVDRQVLILDVPEKPQSPDGPSSSFSSLIRRIEMAIGG